MILAFATVYVVWGSSYLAIRFTLECLPPFLMAGARFLGAGILMMAAATLTGAALPAGAHWRSAFILGTLFFVFGNGGVVYAELTVPSGHCALVVATLPLMMAVLEWASGRAPPPGRASLIGLFLGFAGVALLVVPVEQAAGHGLSGGSRLLGLTILLASSVSWSVGSLWGRVLPQSPSLIMATGMQMAAGGMLLTMLGTALGEPARLDLGQVTWKAGLSFAYLVFFASILAFTAYVWLLSVTRAALVSTYAYVNPVIAVFLGWLLAGEPMGSQTILSTLAILVSVALIKRPS